MNIPKYKVGSDIIIWRGKLPDMISIEAVYMKKNSTQWMYHIFSQQSSGYDYLSESAIDKMKSKHKKPVYDIPMIKDLYNKNFLWVQNIHKRDIANKISELNKVEEIESILVIKRAYFPNGDLAHGYYGIWIKY